MPAFANERDGQIAFYEDYLPSIDKDLTIDDVLSDNSDGVVRGTLLEFKLTVNDLNRVLFQAIKYLSARRMKGKPVPAQILLVSLNQGRAYLYKSAEYLTDIEKTYVGAASKELEGFISKPPVATYEYASSDKEESDMIASLRCDGWTKINIDENCIVGWAMTYYAQNKGARKADFLGDREGKVKIVGEIRNPNVLKDYINPYEGGTNVRFNYLMDQLNDFIAKKDLGAFYTPDPYAEKSVELVREAIARVPEGNDYVIIDRCAGTGNLERFLNDEELSHTILSTLEYYEYKVMFELLADKVRHIIPPSEKEDTFVQGMVRGSDALTEEFVNNQVIRQYIENPNCTIIMFENVPFAEATSLEHQVRGEGKKSGELWKSSWVARQMKAEVKGSALNDLGNAFIWSAFKYYLRQPTDSYIVFSPIKYWKAQRLISKRFLGGFACDRAHFHARKHVCVVVALWSNEDDADLEQFDVEGYDIQNESLVSVGTLPIKRIKTSFSSVYYDKRDVEVASDGILCALNGTEYVGTTRRVVPSADNSVLGYMAVYGSGFDQPDLHSSLLTAGRYDGNGFWLRRDNYLTKLPMYSAGRYISYINSWTERGRIMKSADGSQSFGVSIERDEMKQWLLRNLLFCCLEYQNHMRTFTGSDGRLYRNELCLDTTNGETIASAALKGLKKTPREEGILKAWSNVLDAAKKCDGYDASKTYGHYQIGVELNTSRKNPETDEIVYDYPELNGHIKSLKALVKQYYLDEIVPVLFKYEFLK